MLLGTRAAVRGSFRYSHDRAVDAVKLFVAGLYDHLVIDMASMQSQVPIMSYIAERRSMSRSAVAAKFWTPRRR